MVTEAVQLREWGQWHAVLGGDKTACGRSALKAVKMWESWDEHPWDRCKQCVRALSALE